MFNKILLILLAIALIGFVIVLAILTKHTVELLKKTKGLVGFCQGTVESIKGKFEKLTDRALVAVNKVVDDTSTGVKTVAAVGVGLTAINLATGFVNKALRTIGGLLFW